MIYNESLNLLFVHIQKTAGTSIHQALLNEEGSLDIRPHHLRLCDVRLPRTKPRVVAVVRNPWERHVSWYRMMVRKGVHNAFSAYLLQPEPSGEEVTFSTFVRRTAAIRETAEPELRRPLASYLHAVRPKLFSPYLKSLGWNQEDYLTVDGAYLADEVLRFEHLEAQWHDLGGQIKPGEGWSHVLPKANRDPGRAQLNWREVYQREEDVELVAAGFARDIQRFGFAFDR